MIVGDSEEEVPFFFDELVDRVWASCLLVCLFIYLFVLAQPRLRTGWQVPYLSLSQKNPCMSSTTVYTTSTRRFS